jgi:hypothetical protein
MLNFIKTFFLFIKNKKIETKEEYFGEIDFSKIEKSKLSRPNRRSNGCSGKTSELSNRILSASEKL